MDLHTQQTVVTRQRKLADLLRAAAEQSQYNELPGRMVGAHYVAPSWSQGLLEALKPIFAERRAAQAEALAANQEQDYNAGLMQARKRWMDAAPSIEPAVDERTGPVDPNNPSELARIPAQMPTRGSVLQHTLAGMQIPGMERAAELWNRGMQEEQTREDTQQARMEAQQAQQAQAERLQAERLEASKQAQLAQLEAQRQALADKLAQQERENIRDNQTRLAHQATMQAIATLKNSGYDPVEQRAVQQDITKLSTRMGPVAPVLDAAQQIEDLFDEYRDPETGRIKDIPGIGHVGALPGWARSAGQKVGVLDPKTNPNRAKLERLVGNIMRNQAGLSQTISEQARVLQTMLSSGSYSQKDFVDAWESFTRNLNFELANIKAGHRPEAVEAYLARGGSLTGPASKWQPTGDAAKRARLNELRSKREGK